MLTKDAVKLYLLEIEIRRDTPKTIRSYPNALIFSMAEKYNYSTLINKPSQSRNANREGCFFPKQKGPAIWRSPPAWFRRLYIL